jgi:hypothetical protein
VLPFKATLVKNKGNRFYNYLEIVRADSKPPASASPAPKLDELEIMQRG